MSWDKIEKLRLRNAPLPFKCFALGFVLAVSLAYVYALGNIAMVVGLTPKDIAIHYYGATEKVPEVKAQVATEEALDLDKMDDTEKVSEIGPRPSFKNLVAEGHFHLFGMSSFFFGLCFLALFTGMGTLFKSIITGGSFLFIILDNVSFMATRFLGPKLSYLTAISGGFMGIFFMVLWGSIVYELLQKKEVL